MIKPWLRRFLTGYTLTQEYLCVPYEETPMDLTIKFRYNGHEEDVTSRHLFLGYKPVLFGIFLNSDSSGLRGNGNFADLLFFGHGHSSPIAKFRLKNAGVAPIGTESLYFFESLFVRHSFQSTVHQIANRLLQSIQPKPVGNVSLPGNSYDQVRVAYAIPRIISLITLADGERMNMFPTDLHGKLSDNIYVGSLRINGKATAQVEKLKKICISDVASEHFREVYSLGKNHMQDLQPIEQFPVMEERSERFGIPVPRFAVSYRELELIKSMDFGIHRIHFYDVIHEKNYERKPRLAHIHKLYAQWRNDAGLVTRFLQR